MPCASLGSKFELLGIAQHNGEKVVIMKRSKPGSLGCGLALVIWPFVVVEDGDSISGPPHVWTMRVRTENASFAV